MIAKKLIAVAAIAVVNWGAYSKQFDCKLTPADLANRMLASDPTVIRLLVGKYSRDCPGKVQLAASALLEASRSGRTNLVLEALERRIAGAQRDSYRNAIKDFTEDGRLASFAEDSPATGGLSLPPIAATIVAGVQTINSAMVSAVGDKIRQQYAVETLGRAVADIALTATSGAGAANADAATSLLLQEPDATQVIALLSKRPGESYANLRDIFESAGTLRPDKQAALKSSAEGGSFSTLARQSIDIRGVSVPLSLVFDDVRHGRTSLPSVKGLIRNSARGTRLTTEEIESALGPLLFMLGECVNRAVIDPTNPHTLCRLADIDDLPRVEAALRERLIEWLIGRRDALVSAVLTDLQRRRSRLQDDIKLKLASIISQGEVRRRAVDFLDRPAPGRAIELATEIVRTAFRDSGLDHRTAGLVRVVACADRAMAALLGCEHAPLTAAGIGEVVLAFLPEGSPERIVVEAVLRGRTPTGHDLKTDLDRFVGDVASMVSPASSLFVKAASTARPPSKQQLASIITGVTGVSSVAGAMEPVRQTNQLQSDAINRMDAQIKESQNNLQLLRDRLEALPAFLRENDGISPALAQANRAIETLRAQIVVGANEFQLIQKRVFSANSSFDDRLAGMRMLMDSAVANRMPPETAQRIRDTIELADVSLAAWRSVTALAQDPSASTMGAAIGALQRLPLDENSKKNLQAVSNALSLYSTAATVFAASNPVGWAVAGLGFLSSGGGGLLGGGGGGGLFGGGGGGPDPAIMAELRAISRRLVVIEQKIDFLIDLQKAALRKLDELAVQISKNQAVAMQTLFEVRTLQEQAIERLNFYGASWTRNCSAIGSAMQAVGAYDIGREQTWSVLKANVDNVVDCIAGMQTWIQNARDGKTYSTRLLSSVLPSAMEGCRIQVIAGDNPCDRYRDWAVSAYEAAFRAAQELKTVPTSMTSDGPVKRNELSIFLWHLINPATDVRALDGRARRSASPARMAQAWAEPFSVAACGLPPADFRIDPRPATAAYGTDALDPLSLMNNPISPEWVTDHVQKVVDYHGLINLRPFLRSNAIDPSLLDPEAHKEGAWALLCNARIALQIAIAQQSLMSGDALLPILYDAVFKDGKLLKRPAAGASNRSTQQEQHSTVEAADTQQRRRILFELFRSNRLLARNFLVYAIVREFDRFGDRRQEGCGAVTGVPCLSETPRHALAYDFARAQPTNFGVDYRHRCGVGVLGLPPKDAEHCLMTRLLPRLRGETEATMGRADEDVTLDGPKDFPLLRYITRPFVVREVVGSRAYCRIEPGQTWYFIWPQNMKHEAAEITAYLYGRRLQESGVGAKPAEEAKRKEWDASLATKERETCEQFQGPLLHRESGAWTIDIVDGEQLFAMAVPSHLEVASTVLKHPPLLTRLLRLDRRIVEQQQTIRDLTHDGNDASQKEARKLFILATIAALATDRPALIPNRKPSGPSRIGAK